VKCPKFGVNRKWLEALETTRFAHSRHRLTAIP
jgi:hypothetical protein